MTEHVVRRAGDAAGRRGAVVEVRYDGANEQQMRLWLGDDIVFREQGAGDLGERMARAASEAFGSGSSGAVIVGSDCPEISESLLADALDALSGNDVVLGPSEDGGYYLIGLQRDAAQLFSGPEWGTSSVLEATMRIARECALTVHLLPVLTDVDRPDDLAVCERVGAAEAGLISVVIPTLNEEDEIGGAVEAARHASNVEVIVVDGGSTDETVRSARESGAVVLETSRGRARQMNAGAEAAQGEILCFVHADTLLPDGYDRDVRRIVAEESTAAGAFELRIDAPGGMLRFVEGLANWRARRLQMPYGDQALFMRREVFVGAGRFPDMPLMDDYEMVRRLKRRGRIVIAPKVATTSARRWLAHGVVKTTLINQCVILGYHLGVPPAQLARWYRGEA